jgi:hypothetical protein
MPVNLNNTKLVVTRETLQCLLPGGVQNLDNVEIVELARPLTPDEVANWIERGLIADDAQIEEEQR